MWWSTYGGAPSGRLPPLRPVAAGRRSSAVAPAGDRDPADNAGGDRTQAAPHGLPLLLHQHLRCEMGGAAQQGNLQR